MSSEVLRHPDGERAIPCYALTDKGAEVLARLVAAELGDATVDRPEPDSR